LDGHSKAMSMHDAFSAFNKKSDPLAPRVSKAMVQTLLPQVLSSVSSSGINDTRDRHDKVIPSEIHIPQPFESFG